MDITASEYFSEEEIAAVKSAIQAAEKNTSGEIRVHLEAYCRRKNVLDRAARVFAKLKMHKTKLRNGVLIYLAFEDRKFAIIGDKGINRVVGQNFWEDVRDILQDHFSKREFIEGLTKGIALTGEKLKVNFPYQLDDVNELPDDISMG
jgi:uncharacterized membrane protein